MTEPPFRLTLRQLPLPAKLVLTVFLLAVGLGYTSAIVQLHLQHSGRSGEALPTMDDVVERFSGLKKAGTSAGPPQSRIARVISGPRDGGFDKNNMVRAFFDKSSDHKAEVRERGAEAVDAERETERRLVLAWLAADPAVRKAAYEADKFPLPPDLAKAPLHTDWKKDTGVAIKSLIDARCVKCHTDGNQKPEFDTFAQIEPHATAPPQEVLPGGWVRSSRQMSMEGLTQSTHAHLLSFAVLFTLTGLTFAFTSYPAAVRTVLGPWVLFFQVLDVSCWWLARLDGVGPYFATAIVGTGGLVGLGLMLQIILSLFNMYGSKGKIVLVLLFAVATAGAGVLFTKVIGPALEEERQKALAPAETKAEVKPAEPAKVPPAEDKPAGKGK